MKQRNGACTKGLISNQKTNSWYGCQFIQRIFVHVSSFRDTSSVMIQRERVIASLLPDSQNNFSVISTYTITCAW